MNEGDASPRRCFFCDAEMPEHLVRCPKCGFDHKLHYHTSAEGQAVQGKWKRRVAAWPRSRWLGAFIVLLPVALAAILLLLASQPEGTTAHTLGSVLTPIAMFAFYAAGGLCFIVGYVWLLVIAYRDNVVQFILCLMCSLYAILYGIWFAQEEVNAPLYLLGGGAGLLILSWTLATAV